MKYEIEVLVPMTITIEKTPNVTLAESIKRELRLVSVYNYTLRTTKEIIDVS